MIAALRKLNAPALLERFLRDVVTPSYDGSENAGVACLGNVLGDAQAAAVLSSLVSAQMPKRPNECSELLLALSEDPSLCFPEVAEAEVAGLDSIGARDAETESPDSEPEDLRLGTGRSAAHARPPIPRKPAPGVAAFQGRDVSAAPLLRRSPRVPVIFSPVTLVVPAIERICAGRGKVTRRLRAAFGICGRARRSSCSGAARFLRSRPRTGI